MEIVTCGCEIEIGGKENWARWAESLVEQTEIGISTAKLRFVAVEIMTECTEIIAGSQEERRCDTGIVDGCTEMIAVREHGNRSDGCRAPAHLEAAPP
jgi:hypothetical protein